MAWHWPLENTWLVWMAMIWRTQIGYGGFDFAGSMGTAFHVIGNPALGAALTATEAAIDLALIVGVELALNDKVPAESTVDSLLYARTVLVTVFFANAVPTATVPAPTPPAIATEAAMVSAEIFAVSTALSEILPLLAVVTLAASK